MLKFRRTSVTERTNTWPGFVDLFSNLVIILIFLLIVFVFLWTTTSIFNKSTGVAKVAELTKITHDQAATINQMSADEAEAKRLLVMARGQLEDMESTKQSMSDQLDSLDAQLAAKDQSADQLTASYEAKMAALKASSDSMTAQLATLTAQLQSSATNNTDLESQRQSLTAEIARLNDALAAAQAKAQEQEVQYVALSNQLNAAMADKIAELAKYQSQFYGAIKLALAGFPGVETSGDRFVVSSDILFPTGSYQLGADGKNQLRVIARLIGDLETKIPSDVQWIIRVDGHTDKKPVIRGTRSFANNTQLSLLRAQVVANELAANGASRVRLIPSGFGDTHPIATGNTPVDLQRNRRIELRLTMP